LGITSVGAASGSVAAISVGDVVAGSAGTSDSTGAGIVFVGGTIQAESNVTIKDRNKKLRFILSPYFVMF